MNHTRKFAALLLAVLLLVASLPVAALADSYKVQNLELNQWYSLQSSSNTIYKLKATGDTVLSFNWKNIKSNTSSSIRLYSDRTCNDQIAVEWIDAASGSSAFVLYSGTYYIQMYDEKESGKVRFSTKSASAINKPNYCMSKAITVKAGKKVTIAQTKKENYHRWYRIKLPKTQAITFEGVKQYDFDFTLYDRNLNEISCSYRDNAYVTQGLQPKGTYYMEVDRAYTSELAQKGQYISFSWK